MASSYPGSADSFTTIASDKKTSDSVGGRTHRDMHNDLGDAIEAVQGELGTDPSGSYATVKARLEAIEGGTLPPIEAKGDLLAGTADNTYDNVTVGTNDTVLVADSSATAGVKWAQVPTAGIADDAVTAAKIADGAVSYVKLGSDVRIGNLLTANQASIETDTSGWTVDGGVTLSKQASPTYRGSSSLLATCTGTGAAQFSAAAPRIPVTAGDTVTFQLQTHSGSGTRQVQALLLFYDAVSGGTLIGGDSVKGSLVTTGGSWKEATLTTVAPAGATHAVPSVGLAAGTGTDVVYFDAFSFHRGAGGTFALPGTSTTGQSPILSSADGTRWVLAVDNDGVLTAVELT